MVVEFSEYKGHKLIVLKKDDEDLYPFQFGKSKAKLIMANIEEIQKFADEPDVTLSDESGSK